jgi:hypothetical protein
LYRRLPQVPCLALQTRAANPSHSKPPPAKLPKACHCRKVKAAEEEERWAEEQAEEIEEGRKARARERARATAERARQAREAAKDRLQALGGEGVGADGQGLLAQAPRFGGGLGRDRCAVIRCGRRAAPARASARA